MIFLKACSNSNLLCRRFEIAIFVLIFLNMVTMGIEHYNQPHAVFFVLEVSNAFFTTVFGLGLYIPFLRFSLFLFLPHSLCNERPVCIWHVAQRLWSK